MKNSLWIPDYDVVHRCQTDHFQISVVAFPEKVVGKFVSLPRNWQVATWELAGIGKRHEFYTRGDDLVERYFNESDDLTTEIYYRVLPQREGIELILSRQTSLLDSTPEITIDVRFDDANSVSTFNSANGWNPPGLGPENRVRLEASTAMAVGCLDAVQYGLYVYPGDCEFLDVERTNEETIEAKISMFTAPLEKGVIRRSRLRIVRAEGDQAMQQLADRYRAFCDSEIPLTT